VSRSRLEFKQLLDTVGQDESLGDEGKATVYGQVPENTTMTYPAIRFEKGFEEVLFADNIPYEVTDRYSVTCIEEDPNTPVAKLVRLLPMCSFNRFYVADNLNHTVYNIYF
jgi:hypothetical protein